MDAYCATIKASTHMPQSSKGGLSYGDNGFLGEKLKGSLTNNFGVNQLTKCLKTEKKVRRFKAGVAFSVITTKETKEALVSSRYLAFAFLVLRINLQIL